MSERLTQIIVGLVGLTLFGALSVIGVKHAFGAFDDEYQLHGVFAAAGQGLQSGSDVKIRGVNVGEVAGVELQDGRALVHLDIDSDQRVPVTTRAVIRPKTLFGEKFVDLEPGDAEGEGPYLDDGDAIRDTLGGFELERVLADAYPILEALDPAEVAVVLGELAEAGDGLGEEINRSIVNFQRITDVYRRHDDDTRRFLEDLADLSDELADRADDLVGAATDLNVALPELNRRDAELGLLLDRAARLSADVADVLDANRPLLRTGLTDGSRSLQALYDNRDRIGPLVTGMRQYLQTVDESISIPVGDGTQLARIKGVLGGPPCGADDPTGYSCLAPVAPEAASPSPPGGADGGPTPAGPILPDPSSLLPRLPLAVPSHGADAVTDLIGALLR